MNLQSEFISFRPRSRYVLRFSQDVVRSSWSSSGVMPPLTARLKPVSHTKKGNLSVDGRKTCTLLVLV